MIVSLVQKKEKFYVKIIAWKLQLLSVTTILNLDTTTTTPVSIEVTKTHFAIIREGEREKSPGKFAGR